MDFKEQEVNKETFIIRMKDLISDYMSSPEYVPPKIKKQWVSWFFVGWWAISLGIHFSLKHANIEIHLPFGFITISFKGRTQTYNDVTITV